MNLELYLSHGRADPAEQMSDWGIDGPRLPGVVGLHETYRTTLRIIFSDAASANAARLLTGWASWDDCELEASLTDDMLMITPAGQPPAFFGDWGLIVPQEMKGADMRRRNALRRALAFVEGFEGDGMQQGIDGPGGLLAVLRGAVQDANGHPRDRKPAVEVQPYPVLWRDGMEASLRAWLIDEMGMQPDMQGDAGVRLRHDGPNGWHLILTGSDGGGVPTADDWHVDVYDRTSTDLENFNSSNDDNRLTLRQAVAAACGIIAEAR